MSHSPVLLTSSCVGHAVWLWSQEAWSRQQQLKDREMKKLTERVHKLREEREHLSKEVKQLRDHNYSLMVNINSLSQEKSSALLANRDLQIEVS